MISPLLNHRMLGKSHFMSTVDEETIIELLQNISKTPVAVSEVKYVSFADLPHSKKLPPLPKDLSEKSIVDYVNKLVSFRQIIERLDILKGKESAANTNTWYYLFNVFKNPEPKVKMLELMGEYEVPLKPMLGSLSPIIDYFTPEQLTELYESEGNFLENGQIDPVLVNQLVACYLKDSRAGEVWSMIQSNSSWEKFITPGLFVIFANHFLKNNQLAFAIAFANYLQKNYKVNATPILTSMILNVYLKDCPYFDRWLSIVRIFMPGVKKYQVFLNSKTMSNLNDYCSLHNISNHFDVMEGQDFATRKAIYSDLVWKDMPIFELSENSPEFVKTAKFIGQAE
ncbi:hypothetical protein PMKS-001591 [Pichia membranifaciens]|uniref:Uncharacterized protein n=1 Tax=Pichia membranifaciens TaxID=4926 RepID=A0A1Q2YFG1_9ASCO|nr:hypothetical protein PMKS-001591 [Pichia membranifaciens]